MRILLLTTDLQIGGTPTVVRELATRLSKLPDVQIHVACLDAWGPVADQLKSADIPVTALAARGRADISVVGRLVALILRDRLQTVFSFLVHANAIAAIAAPAVWSCASVRFIQSIQTTQPRPRWHWRVQSAVHHAAERIVVPSQSAAHVAHQWSGIPATKITVIPNAVEPADFALDRPPYHGSPRIGFIGRLDPVKRVADLVQALPMLPADATLHLFGEGPDRKNIEAAVDRLEQHARITFHGPVSRPQDALKQIDVLVLPSEAEGFGLVLIEAMAAGVPVVGANVAGIRDVIEDNVSGLLASPANPPALAAAIDRILADAALRQSLITGGHVAVKERYAWSSVLPMYCLLLGIDTPPASA